MPDSDSYSRQPLFCLPADQWHGKFPQHECRWSPTARSPKCGRANDKSEIRINGTTLKLNLYWNVTSRLYNMLLLITLQCINLKVLNPHIMEYSNYDNTNNNIVYFKSIFIDMKIPKITYKAYTIVIVCLLASCFMRRNIGNTLQ